MFVDLVMPDMDGCDLVMRLRALPIFAKTKIAALTGLKEDQYKALALKAGCNAVLTKPAALAEIKAVLAGVVPTPTPSGHSPAASTMRARPNAEQGLPMKEARRIRSDRASKTLTQSESEAAICDGIIRFQTEYLGWTSEQIHIHFVKDLLVVRICGALTLAERQLGRSLSAEKGRDLIKQTRKQLLEVARPMLESIVHEAAGCKVLSMHHDISTVTGEELVLFTLDGKPRFE
jgi:uncharacterized protein YbcI